MGTSRHLDDVIANRNRVAGLQVVFLDTEKYSRRTTIIQAAVIDAFTSCLSKALDDTAKEHIAYVQANNINFRNDIIITLPTGDGAAVIFSFDGLHQAHLSFTRHFFRRLHEHNSASPCDKFSKTAWCNCHSNVRVRAGVADGRGIVYRDLNGNYNVVGSVINLAARVMSLADGNQILFEADAFKQMVDMVDDPSLNTQFREYQGAEVKHGLKVSVYQYVGPEPFINAAPPSQLILAEKVSRLHELIDWSSLLPPGIDRKKILDMELNDMATYIGHITDAQAALAPLLGPAAKMVRDDDVDEFFRMKEDPNTLKSLERAEEAEDKLRRWLEEHFGKAP